MPFNAQDPKNINTRLLKKLQANDSLQARMAQNQESKYFQQALEEYKELCKDEEDDWDQRIDKTGCYVENMALQLCHAETNDWRQCLGEMAMFRSCWSQKGNRERVSTVDRS